MNKIAILSFALFLYVPIVCMQTKKENACAAWSQMMQEAIKKGMVDKAKAATAFEHSKKAGCSKLKIKDTPMNKGFYKAAGVQSCECAKELAPIAGMIIEREYCWYTIDFTKDKYE